MNFKNTSVKIRTTIISTLSALLIGIIVGLFIPQNKSGNEILTDIKQELGSEVKLPEFTPLNQEKNPSATKLTVLSATLVAVEETIDQKETTASTSQLSGIRILGEVQNTGNQSVKNTKTIVRFYDQDKQLLATKVGIWNQSYKFTPLEPEQINVYDFLIAKPPKSSSITIAMEPAESDDAEKLKNLDLSSLKFKNKKLEAQTIERQKGKINYYKFSGTLTNIAKYEIINPEVYVWIKNDKGKVVGLGSKIFETDLLIPKQELKVDLLILPVSNEAMLNYETKILGEKL